MPSTRRPVHPGAPTLLLAETDQDIASQVTDGLLEEGIRVVGCQDGAEVLLRAGVDRPALVLLGTPLPVVDAAKVTELLSHIIPVPVVVGVGAQLSDEAAKALAVGAVALVARPYRLAEILTLLPLKAADRPAWLKVGDIELDPAGLHVYVRGQMLKLPLREFQLLHYLMQNTNRVVSRQQILHELWGDEHSDTNTLSVHVKRLREKLRGVEGNCCTIDTIRGLGYRLECPDRTRVPQQ